MPKVTDFDFPATPAATPSTIVDHLADRAMDPGTPVDPKTAVAEARAKLVALLAAVNDPDEVKGIAAALASLDKIAPSDEPEPEEREPLDLSGMCEGCLLILGCAVDPDSAAQRRRLNEEHREREQARHERDADMAAVLRWLLNDQRGMGRDNAERLLKKHGYSIEAWELDEPAWRSVQGQ